MTRLVSDGVLRLGGDGKLDKAECDARYDGRIRYKSDGANHSRVQLDEATTEAALALDPHAEVNADDRALWEARKARADALRKEMELDEAAGRLVPAEDVEQRCVDITTTVRRFMLGIPVRLAPRLVGLTEHEITQVLDRAIRAGLEGASADLETMDAEATDGKHG